VPAPREQATRPLAQGREAAHQQRLRRGHRRPGAPRAGEGDHPAARHLPLGRRAPDDRDHRDDRNWEDLRRLRHLAQQACRKGFRAIYRRATRLNDELTLARADGSYAVLLARFARADVMIIDDWGLAPPKDQERRDLLEIVEDRCGAKATIITSQLPTAKWHDHLGDPTVADAFCDRLLKNAHRIVLKGPSRWKEGSNTDK
jgi:hypothetical protein